MDIAQGDSAEDAAFDPEIELQVLSRRDLDCDGMKDRAQNRAMKNQQQQENRSEGDEEPTEPTSAAVPLDVVYSIVAHECRNLISAPCIRKPDASCASASGLSRPPA